MTRSDTERAWAQGGTVFGATMMVILGIFQVVEGIAAIAQDRFFVLAPNYAYQVDTTTWGWIHLGLGIVAVLTGFFIFTGNPYARGVGIALAGLSAIANFFWLPYYPLWAIVVIAMAIWVIWSLASTSLRERSTRYAPEPMTESSMESRRWTSTNQPSTNQPGGRHWSDQRPPDSPANMPPPSTMPSPSSATQEGPPAGGTPQH